MKGYRYAGNVLAVVIYLFLLLPIIVVICTSFTTGNRAMFPPDGFTLKWYAEALNNKQFFDSIVVSLKIAVASTTISTVLGVMVSLYFWKTTGRIKAVSELIFMAPMVVPTVVFAVGFLMFFTPWKFFAPFWKLVMSYCAIQIPYMIRSVTAALYGLDVSFEEASLVLGAPPMRTLFKVTLPNIRGGITAGVVFAFVVAFDEAVIIMFLRNAATTTYPLRLYSTIIEQFSPMVSAFSTVFILIAFLIISFVEKKVGLSHIY